MQKYTLLLICALILGLTSCDNEDYKGEPKFILYIQDSPAQEFKGLFVSFSKVELFDGEKWIEVKRNGATFDVMSYSGSDMFKLVDVVIPKGHYTQFRLTFAESQTRLMVDGKSYNMEFNLADQVQLFSHSFDAVEDAQTSLIVDIDAAQSVVQLAEDSYLFLPKMSLIDLQTFGVARGTVVDSKNAVIKSYILIKAVREDGYTKMGYTSPATGQLFIRLPKGKYKISLTAPASLSLETVELVDVIVESRGVAELGAIIMKLNAPL